MTPRADAVAAGPCDSSLVQTGLQHHQGFFVAAADHFPEARHNFAVWARLGGFEEQMSSTQVFCARGDGEQVEDAVVVNLVHGHEDRVLGILLRRHGEVADVGELRER